jgi:radical SAM superfamily enzyme YgiQ (UPF0313 family)
MITVMDPWQADAVMVGEGHAPVVAVLPVFAEEEPLQDPLPGSALGEGGFTRFSPMGTSC